MRFFRLQPSEVGKRQLLSYIAKKTTDGGEKGRIAVYCRVLGVSRQAFYQYLGNRDKPWKYQEIADEMRKIQEEDLCNDTYGRQRMYAALEQRGNIEKLPSERTVYRIMETLGMSHRPKRKPNSLTKEDREAQKSDDLLHRDFGADAAKKKCVTDITEITGSDGKLYLSGVFDCFDNAILGLSMDTNMKAELCAQTIRNAAAAHGGLRGVIIHSDRGSQYTSALYRETVKELGVIQSMNSAGGRCHDNAKCESMWSRMKEELFYGRYDTKKMTVEELKALVWRYFMSYWNNRRICMANGGLPPMVKRRKYYEAMSLMDAA